MKIIDDIKILKAIREQAWQKNQSIGLVPTMGNLHRGHTALIERAISENALTVLSIFLNPTQFDDPEDLNRYPRTLIEDKKIATDSKVDFLFLPKKEALYPDNYRYRISEKQISKTLEGKYRLEHFDGVLTIVMKLLLITRPERAYFGEKDFQQYELIKGMAEAFFLDTQIIPCETVRETSGLALSSRNQLLSDEAQQQAANLYAKLSSRQPASVIERELTEIGFDVEYVIDHKQRRYAAAYLERVRLIDNVPLPKKI